MITKNRWSCLPSYNCYCSVAEGSREQFWKEISVGSPIVGAELDSESEIGDDDVMDGGAVTTPTLGNQIGIGPHSPN